jgi:RNA polymerase sigma-70 factor, ECF subfamily
VDHKKLDYAVQKFKQGDEAYFDIIYEETKTKVYYTILSIVKDHSLAEDLMQETYLKMIEALPKYKRKNQFPAWIATIARNLAINTFNKRKKELLVDIDESEYMFGSEESPQENRYYLDKLLNVLNDDEKQVVIRHVILDEKHKDIALALDKPLGTITWMYQNALKKLKKAGEEDA